MGHASPHTVRGVWAAEGPVGDGHWGPPCSVQGAGSPQGPRSPVALTTRGPEPGFDARSRRRAQGRERPPCPGFSLAPRGLVTRVAAMSEGASLAHGAGGGGEGRARGCGHTRRGLRPGQGPWPAPRGMSRRGRARCRV